MKWKDCRGEEEKGRCRARQEVTSGKLVGCGRRGREAWVWDKPPLPPQERNKTPRKTSDRRGKDESLCGHVEGEMPLGWANGDV